MKRTMIFTVFLVFVVFVNLKGQDMDEAKAVDETSEPYSRNGMTFLLLEGDKESSISDEFSNSFPDQEIPAKYDFNDISIKVFDYSEIYEKLKKEDEGDGEGLLAVKSMFKKKKMELIYLIFFLMKTMVHMI